MPVSGISFTGRSARGVRGIRLGKGDAVIAMALAQKDTELLTVTTLGFAKRSPVEAYRLQSRGGKGIINIKTNERNGMVVAMREVIVGDEIIIITRNGITIRTKADDIRATGRNAQGVRLIRLAEGDVVMDVARVVEEEEEGAEAEAAGSEVEG